MSETRGMLDYLMATLATMANDSQYTDYYFPNFLPTLDSGKYVPYKTSLDLGALQTMEDKASTNICLAGWAVSEGYGAGMATAPPTLNLTSVTVNGLNNGKIASHQVGAANVSQQYPVIFTAQMNAYLSLPNVTVDPGNFEFKVHCCTTDDMKTCNGKHDIDVTADGTLQVDFNAPMFQVTLLLTLNSDLTISVEIPEEYPASGADQTPGLYMYSTDSQAIEVHDITFQADPKYQEDWEKLANSAFAAQETSEKLMAVFNNNLNQPGTRGTFATSIAQQLNSIISKMK